MNRKETPGDFRRGVHNHLAAVLSDLCVTDRLLVLSSYHGTHDPCVAGRSDVL